MRSLKIALQNWLQAHSYDTTGLDADTKDTLRRIIGSIAFATVWSNITAGIAFTGYWKKLGASDFLFGIIIALPALANGFQVFASYILEKTLKRKKMILISDYTQRLLWFPFGLVPIIIPMSQPMLRLWASAVLALVSAAMGPFVSISFNSICFDVIPGKIRGRYLATRSLIATLVGIVIGLLTGVVLDKMPGMEGYCIVFCIAALFGTMDISLYVRMKVPPMKPAENRGSFLKMFRAVLADKPFVRIIIFCTLWEFSVFLAAQYYNVYMLSVMELSNFQITLFCQIASNIALVLVISKWGKWIDIFGSMPVIFLTGLLTCMHAVLWGFVGGQSILAVTLVSALIGAVWQAYCLASTNLYVNHSPEASRSMYIAVYTMFTQLLGVTLGNATGGWLLDNPLAELEKLNWHIGSLPLTRYNLLFFLSGILRFAVILGFLPIVKDQGENLWKGLKRTALEFRQSVREQRMVRRAGRHRRHG